MELSQLIKSVQVVQKQNFFDCEISGLSVDSNKVFEGDLFICIDGFNFDSHTVAESVVSKGARAVVCERQLNVSVPQIIVEDTRLAMECIARNFYARPDTKLNMIGVTGTNGKTTTTYMMESILKQAGKKVGVIGTLGIKYSNIEIEPILTTPDSIFLYKTLAEMVENKIEYVVMEISAHAIALNKLKSIEFERIIFTNCTHDHLDFFKNFKEYRTTKERIFLNNCKLAILNFDDELGREIATKTHNFLSYGLENPADVFAININEKIYGSSYVINLLDEIGQIELNFLGIHNVYNSLASCLCAKSLGIDIDTITNGLAWLEGVRGRLQLIREYNSAYIFIDYAHTPDGLEKSLSCLKKHCSGKLICLFGCGGNRDEQKRPIMGKISTMLADFSIFTSDNPRNEDAYEIVEQIEKGANGNYIAITDREDATKYAIKMLQKGDILLLAGKGAEKYQEVMGIKHIYNDYDIVTKLINN